MTGPTELDRMMSAFRRLVRIVFPRLEFFGLYEYSIVTVNGTPPSVTLDCSAIDPSLGLPDLRAIPMQPGIAGATSVPDTGITCVVFFLNGDPTNPRILGVGSLGTIAAARLGDSVTVSIPEQTVVGGGGGTIAPQTVSGTISSASEKVFIG